MSSRNDEKTNHYASGAISSLLDFSVDVLSEPDGSVSLPPEPFSETHFGGSESLVSSLTILNDKPISNVCHLFTPSSLAVSSVSYGIGELGSNSLDGSVAGAMSSASTGSESCHTGEGIQLIPNSGSDEDDVRCKVLDSVARMHSNKVSVNDSFPKEQPIGAQLPPPSTGKVDHSLILTETGLDSHNLFPSVIFPTTLENDFISSSVMLGERDNATSMKDFPFEIVPAELPNMLAPPSEYGVVCTKNLYSTEAVKKIEKFALNLVILILNEALSQSVPLCWSIKCSGQCNQELCREDYKEKNLGRETKIKNGEKSLFSSLGLSSCNSSLCWTPELPFSPSHRPYSRSSKRSSSLSISHDSLIGYSTTHDASHLIKGAVSHDALVTFPTSSENQDKEESCNSHLDSDVYSQPVDVVKPYEGPILQPKVIMRQPKKKYYYQNVRLHLEGEKGVGIPSCKKNHKKKKGKFNSIRGGKNCVNSSEICSSMRGSQTTSETTTPQSIEITNVNKDERNEVRIEAESHSHQKEVRCYEQSKFCKIIQFSSNKPHKRKEVEVKMDRKKSKSLSSNIRNILVTFFSFKKTHKENGSCINAKNEFIDASSQGFFESSDGVKWGKICPLPSAPPLRNSVQYSAFSDCNGSTNGLESTRNQIHSHRKETTLTNTCNSNPSTSSHHTTTLGHSRLSNSISPASLLSCLGHPRTNSINEQEHRPRPRPPLEASKQILSTPPCKSSSVGSVSQRALPPLPASFRHQKCLSTNSDPALKPHTHNKLDEGCDFASIIEKVKNYGWYWGPISGEAAEKVLWDEPDGSFIVRDSSDYHYIFSLTFRLNGDTRHVRIEHDQGNFSFGGFTRFKSQTIVDFIEKAVEHSRSGRYLFFLHRRPVLGPMRVQLLHPVSRFKHVQSLQHLCRFVIVKQVRKDLIHNLPLPQRLKDYLSSPHYYSEQVEQQCLSLSATSTDNAAALHERIDRSPGQHSTPSKIRTRLDASALPLPSRRLGLCENHWARIETNRNRFPINLRCNFSDLGQSVGPLKRKRTRDRRLSSSHSSLENGSLWAVSPSTISTESNAGKASYHSFNSKKTSQLFCGSSHSSPSSPVPLDYSPPDCLSSSEDVFQMPASSVHSPKSPFSHSDGQIGGIQPHGGALPKNHHQETALPQCQCGSNASTSYQKMPQGFAFVRAETKELELSPKEVVDKYSLD